MLKSKGLLIDKVEGVHDFLHHDETEGKFYRELVEDAEPILEDAKARHKEGLHGSNEFRFAGRFPVLLVEEWLRVRNLTMKDFKNDVVKDFLNDSNHAAFRVWPGRV